MHGPVSVSQRFLQPFAMKHTSSVSQTTQAYAAYVDMFIALKLTPHREGDACRNPRPLCVCPSVSGDLKPVLSLSLSERFCQFN